MRPGTACIRSRRRGEAGLRSRRGRSGRSPARCASRSLRCRSSARRRADHRRWRVELTTGRMLAVAADFSAIISIGGPASIMKRTPCSSEYVVRCIAGDADPRQRVIRTRRQPGRLHAVRPAGQVADEFARRPDRSQQGDVGQRGEELARGDACRTTPFGSAGASAATGRTGVRHGIDQPPAHRSAIEADPRERASPDIPLLERLAERHLDSILPGRDPGSEPDRPAPLDQCVMHRELVEAAVPDAPDLIECLTSIDHIGIAHERGRSFREGILVAPEVTIVNGPVQQPV